MSWNWIEHIVLGVSLVANVGAFALLRIFSNAMPTRFM
jgi:hypothetical protein